MKHYKENLSEFVNQELATDARQAIAEHLLVCAECRAEHDEIKFGAALADQLKRTDAPENLWLKIENAFDAKGEKASSSSGFAFYGWRVAAAGLLVSLGLAAAVYFALLKTDAPQIVRNEPNTARLETPQVVPITKETATNLNSNLSPTSLPNTNSKVSAQTQVANANVKSLPKNAPVEPQKVLPVKTNLPSWNVETLEGAPRVGDSFDKAKLAVGEFLETDANSRARVQVADIGDVEVAPNSRVKLVNTRSTEHRLALERGTLKAKIFAPPRLFIVDTPSAVAVDLGCEYTLEVDQDGNARLHVTSGFVALENGKYESIVPAGAIALTRKGKGVGTPFADDASPKLRDALYQFDFENGGSDALQTIIAEANLYDSLTLWHLLARVPRNERGKIFNALSNLVEPPAGVTIEGIVRLDKKMLEAWWTEIESVWFE